MGLFFNMTFFAIQSVILIGTFIFSFILYTRFVIFLKPKNRKLDINGEEIFSDDDEFIDQDRDSFDQKRDVIRRGFRSKYFAFNLKFIYLLVTNTVRTGTYVGLRMISIEKILDWIYIKPSIFYLTFATDMMILTGVLYFIYQSTELKEKYQPSTGDSDVLISSKVASIFPNTDGGPAQIDSPEDYGSVDGDKDLVNRSSGSSDEERNWQ